MDGKIAIFVFVLIARLGSDQVNAQVCTHPYCRTGYTYDAATNFCYKYVGTPATYAAATQYCANDCSAIASIRFSQENDFIDSYIIGAAGVPQKTWIGLTSSGASNNPATWYWTDGSQLTYSNWHKNGAPFGNNYQCADFQPTMNGTSNFWENSFPCSYSLPFLCKAMPVCSDTVSNGVATCTYPQCNAGYVYSPVSNLCYKFVQNPLSYQAATQFCTNDCGAIASIHFALENDFVDQLILQSNTNVNKKTWIGFAVNTQAVQWQWTDQGPITYTNWYQNKPVTAGCINGVAPWGNGNGCVNFQPTGSGCDGGSNYWENFYSCATALPFVCKQTPICGSAAQCSILGGPCRIDSNCDGQPCTMDYQCCSGHCSAAQICQCILNGGTCQTGVACCGGQACNSSTNTC